MKLNVKKVLKECQKNVKKLLTSYGHEKHGFDGLKRKKKYYVYIKNEHESSHGQKWKTSLAIGYKFYLYDLLLMFRKDLLAFLIKEQEEAKEKKNYLFSSGYHDSESIYNCIYALLAEYGDKEDEIDDIDDIIDDLYEICDSHTPIYYGQIAEWFASNWYAVNETVEEFGMDSKDFDIMKTIQSAYCLTLENETRKELEELIEYYNDKQEGTEEKEEQNDIYF